MQGKSIFSKNLSRIRSFYELTREEAAANIGIKRSTLIAYEEGRAEPCIEILLKIADFYKVSNLSSFLKNQDFLLFKNSSCLEAQENIVQKKYLQLDLKMKKVVDILLDIKLE